MREGGDYWLAYTGPSGAFREIAAATHAGGGRLAAKLQTGCGYEMATVPFVPVPGILYRKYREMKALGIDSVMQCWLVGNYPGTQNAAAGELAFEDFTEDEDTFLTRQGACRDRLHAVDIHQVGEPSGKLIHAPTSFRSRTCRRCRSCAPSWRAGSRSG